MTDNPTKRLIERIRENKMSLKISRIPDKTKEEFIALANEEFCGDYGMAFKEVFSYYLEHHAIKALFFQNIDSKLNYILEILSQTEQKEEKPKTKSIRLVNGKRIEVKKEVSKNG